MRYFELRLPPIMASRNCPVMRTCTRPREHLRVFGLQFRRRSCHVLPMDGCAAGSKSAAALMPRRAACLDLPHDAYSRPPSHGRRKGGRATCVCGLTRVALSSRVETATHACIEHAINKNLSKLEQATLCSRVRRHQGYSGPIYACHRTAHAAPAIRPPQQAVALPLTPMRACPLKGPAREASVHCFTMSDLHASPAVPDSLPTHPHPAPQPPGAGRLLPAWGHWRGRSQCTQWVPTSGSTTCHLLQWPLPMRVVARKNAAG